MSNPNAPKPMAQGIAKLATDFEKNSFDSAPEFTLNTFFRKHSDDDYELLTEEPVGWAYNYNNYYHEPRYTDPDLHRRIDNQGYIQNDYDTKPVFVNGFYYNSNYELLNDEPDDWDTNYNGYYQRYSPQYEVGVFGVESYRIIKSHYHDEGTTESEIP